MEHLGGVLSTVFHHELEFVGYAYRVKIDAEWVKICAGWNNEISFTRSTTINICNINNNHGRYTVEYCQFEMESCTSLFTSVNITTKDFLPPTIRVIIHLSSQSQSNFPIPHFYHTFNLLLPTMTLHTSELLTILLMKTNHKQNGDGISLASNFLYVVDHKYTYISSKSL